MAPLGSLISMKDRFFMKTIKANVLTGYGGENWSPSEKQQYNEIFRITSHEFAHALGLGHTWREKNDMMCSSDFSQRNVLERLAKLSGIGSDALEKIDDTYADSPDAYIDSNMPREFDFRAVLNLYGKDGIKPPNRFILPGYNDYYMCRPLRCQQSAGSSSQRQDFSTVPVPSLSDINKKNWDQKRYHRRWSRHNNE